MTLTSIIIITSWIILWLLWLITSFFQKRSKEKPPLLARMFYSGLFAISIFLLLFSSRIYILNYIIIYVSTLVNILAIIFSISGLIICIYSRIILGSNWSKDVMIKKDHQLITKGPYKYIRHPIYTGLLMLYLGTMLAIGNVGSVLGFIILAFSFYLKANEEENLMIKNFGERYILYQRETKKFLPYLY